MDYTFTLKAPDGTEHTYEGQHLLPGISAHVATTVDRIFGTAMVSAGVTLLDALAPLIGQDPNAVSIEVIAATLLQSQQGGQRIDGMTLGRIMGDVLGHPMWPGVLPDLFRGIKRDGVELVTWIKPDEPPSLFQYNAAYTANWDELKYAALMIVVHNRFLTGSGYFGDLLQSLVQTQAGREEMPLEGSNEPA